MLRVFDLGLVTLFRRGGTEREVRTITVLTGLTLIIRILFEKDPFRRSIQIFVLPIAEGPQESGQSGQSHTQGDKDQPPHGTHPALLRALGLMFASRGVDSLMALATTMTEDSDIATAATRGVT